MHLSKIGLVVLLVSFLSVGCAKKHEESGTLSEQGGKAPPQGATLAGSLLPATYAGVLPCADCPGIRTTLTIRADNVFFLRMTYLGKGKGEGDSFDDIGVWALSADGRTLILRGGREAPVMFAVKSADVLRKLDLQGKEIESKLNYDLLRTERFETFEPRLFLRGTYSYLADAGVFKECITELRLPVAQEGDNAALEAGYLKARREVGEQLLVNLEGRIAIRPRVDGLGGHHVLVVERFIHVWPGETCGARFSTAALENTYWKLVRLGEQPVIVSRGRREPHLRLVSEGRRAQGFAGCNRLLGAYELEGQKLRFAHLATTRMACPDGMEPEQAFLRTLESTARWNIVGEHLELYDSGGTLLARFEARTMK